MTGFKETEYAAWMRKAASYDDHFARVTARAIPAFIECAGYLDGQNILDICCGTGDLAHAFHQAGAQVTAADFAEPMVSIARIKYAGITFVTGDAEALEFPDNSFDLVTCSFGLWHLAHPEKAVAEAARVLRPGGRLIYSAWAEQARNDQTMFLINDAVRRLGRLDVDLPIAPAPYRFADAGTATEALTALEFADVQLSPKTVRWYGNTGQDLLDLIMKSIVRAPMLIEAQTPDAQRAIKDDIVKNAQALKQGGKITMDWPYMLVVATARQVNH